MFFKCYSSSDALNSKIVFPHTCRQIRSGAESRIRSRLRTTCRLVVHSISTWNMLPKISYEMNMLSGAYRWHFRYVACRSIDLIWKGLILSKIPQSVIRKHTVHVSTACMPGSGILNLVRYNAYSWVHVVQLYSCRRSAYFEVELCCYFWS